DLFQPILGTETVEATEDVGQQRNRLLRRKPSGQRGEINQIGKQYGRFCDVVGNRCLTTPHTFDNTARENVGEQRLGALLFHAQLVEQPFLLEQGADACAQQDGVERLMQIVLG